MIPYFFEVDANLRIGDTAVLEAGDATALQVHTYMYTVKTLHLAIKSAKCNYRVIVNKSTILRKMRRAEVHRAAVTAGARAKLHTQTCSGLVAVTEQPLRARIRILPCVCLSYFNVAKPSRATTCNMGQTFHNARTTRSSEAPVLGFSLGIPGKPTSPLVRQQRSVNT